MVLSLRQAHSNIIANSDGNLNWQGGNYPLSDDLKNEKFAGVINGGAAITSFS